jgi:hypothetical protein
MSDDETRIADLSGTPEAASEPADEPEADVEIGQVLDPVSPTVPPLVRAGIAADLRDYLIDYSETIRSIEREMTRHGRPSKFRQMITASAIDAAAATAGKIIAGNMCDTIDESIGKEKS